jgi:hypothetical protein
LVEYIKGKESLDVAMSKYMDVVLKQQRRARAILAVQQKFGHRYQYLADVTFQKFLASGEEADFDEGMEKARNLLYPPRHNTNAGGGGGGGMAGIAGGHPPPPPPGSTGNICAASGCGQACSLKCTYRMCGRHKKLCKDPKCKKHKKF